MIVFINYQFIIYQLIDHLVDKCLYKGMKFEDIKNSEITNLINSLQMFLGVD